MSLDKRIALYQQIEAYRKRPLIVYVTSKRKGVVSMMSSDAIPCLIEQIDKLPPETKEVDFLIVSFGGDPMVAWRISSLLRQRVDKVSVLIPQSAYSAATLVALGANEIMMHPNGNLGPIDFQIVMEDASGQSRSYSTEDISAFLDFVREKLKLTDQEHIRTLFEKTCQEVGSLGIGFTARSSKLAEDMGGNLLAEHMNSGETGQAKIHAIIDHMNRKFQSHGYPVNRKEAKNIGLNVQSDSTLDALMWQAWLLLEEELKEREPFDPICELLNSSEASKLLAPVPQLDVPLCATATGHYNTTLSDLNNAVTSKVEPVDYGYTDAIVESPRVAFAHKVKGKILSHRTPDMQIRYNVLVKSSVWENLPVQSQRKERKSS
ncbi:hypothetical protein ACFPT7_05760 [Acidicapsa dinghuensis]|uniref:Serine protease n=1 Tax=Acidicapsa dinghuensis TaxID=2218256 RepID=A0ABW1EEW3_9BACT|nr:hypothetical protein [Acidicapsa dinghuensis]